MKTHSAVLILILALTALVLTWATWNEMVSDRQEIEQLMAAYVQSIGDVIGESGGHGIAAYDSWTDEIARRLLDNARWIAWQDSLSPLNVAQLDELARLYHLNRIHIFDANGYRVVSNYAEVHDDVQCRTDATGSEIAAPPEAPNILRCRDQVRPLCEGRAETVEIGFRESRFMAGSRFAAAVARPRGGAVLVNIKADSIRATLQQVEPAHLIETLGQVSGVKYVVIQNRNEVLAASSEIHGLAPLPPELLAGSMPMTAAMPARELETEVGPVFEVIRTLSLRDVGEAYLRVGLNAEVFGEVRENLRRQAWIRTLVFLVTVGLAVILAMAWQRSRILRHEIQGVQAELRAREQEALRTAKLVAMGEIAARVAHQIRNPLNTIHMAAQQMERDFGRGEVSIEQATHVRSESRRIEGIVQQFLELARPYIPHWQSFDVGAVVAGCVHAAEASFQAADIALEPAISSVTAELDHEFVIEILENLLFKAKQASPVGGRVRVTVQKAGPDVEIIVEDQGSGVPVDLRERIFDPYFTTKPSGTGLGLSLIARMTAVMGGRVQLESTPESGARFRVRLPRRRTPGRDVSQGTGAG